VAAYLDSGQSGEGVGVRSDDDPPGPSGGGGDDEIVGATGTAGSADRIEQHRVLASNGEVVRNDGQGCDEFGHECRPGGPGAARSRLDPHEQLGDRDGGKGDVVR